MAEFESLRDIAARLVADYQRKYPRRMSVAQDEGDAIVEALKATQVPAPVVEAAIQMEQLNERDRDWLARLKIRV